MTRHVTIIDAAHPLAGRTFPLLRDSSPRGKQYIVLLLPDGRHRSVPRAATDLDAPAPPLRAVGTLPRISVRTILTLAQRVHAMLGQLVPCPQISPANIPPAPSATPSPAAPPPLPPLWSQLDPQCRQQFAQHLAVLIQRRRTPPRQEEPAHERP